MYIILVGSSEGKRPLRIPRHIWEDILRWFLGHAMAQVASRRPLTVEARVNPCGICGVQSGKGTGFSPSS
jgi:hypothetical protein